jgi:hypothetical protein
MNKGNFAMFTLLNLKLCEKFSIFRHEFRRTLVSILLPALIGKVDGGGDGGGMQSHTKHHRQFLSIWSSNGPNLVDMSVVLINFWVNNRLHALSSRKISI